MHNTNIFATWTAQWKYGRTIDKKQNIQIPINECQNNGLSRTLKCFNCSHLCAHLIKCLPIMSNIPCLVRLNMGSRSCKEAHLAQPFFKTHAAGATGKTGPFCFHVLAKAVADVAKKRGEDWDFGPKNISARLQFHVFYTCVNQKKIHLHMCKPKKSTYTCVNPKNQLTHV